MAIRLFQHNDFDEVAEIYTQSKLDELSFEKHRFELLPLAQDDKRLRELMESEIFVYDEGGILGYGAVFEKEIRALFVHPSSSGKGIGTSLLEFLISYVETPVMLYVAKITLQQRRCIINTVLPSPEGLKRSITASR